MTEHLPNTDRTLDERVEPVPRSQVVRGVLALGGLDDLDGRRDAVQRPRHGLGVLAAGLVAVGDHDHARATQHLGVRAPPLPRALRVARGHRIRPLDRVHILLALDDEHPLATRDASAHLRQAIEDAARMAELPFPPSGPIRLALPEVLRLKADHLVEQLAVLVDVVVGVDDAAAPAVALLRQVLRAQPERVADILERAARVAVQQPPAVVALDAETRLLIGVRRAPRQPPSAVALRPAEPVKQLLLADHRPAPAQPERAAAAAGLTLSAAAHALVQVGVRFALHGTAAIDSSSSTLSRAVPLGAAVTPLAP